MGFGGPWSARAQRDLVGPPPVLTILPLHKYGWQACHHTVHIPSGLWALLILFMTKSSHILQKVGIARVPLGSGEWHLGARISGARPWNLGWCVCGGAQFEDRPQSSPCRASLARKSGDALMGINQPIASSQAPNNLLQSSGTDLVFAGPIRCRQFISQGTPCVAHTVTLTAQWNEKYSGWP